MCSPHPQKPAGGVPMFGESSVLAGLKAKLPRRQSSSSSESSDHEDQIGHLVVGAAKQPIEPADIHQNSSKSELPQLRSTAPAVRIQSDRTGQNSDGSSFYNR